MNCIKVMTIENACTFACLAFYELGELFSVIDPQGHISTNGGNALLIDNASGLFNKINRLESGVVTNGITSLRDSEDSLITCTSVGITVTSAAPFFIASDVGKNLFWKFTGSTCEILTFIDDQHVTVNPAGPAGPEFVQVLIGYAQEHAPLTQNRINAAGDLAISGSDGLGNDKVTLYPKSLNGAPKYSLVDIFATGAQVMESGLLWIPRDKLYNPTTNLVTNPGSGFLGTRASRDSDYILEIGADIKAGDPLRVYDADTDTLLPLTVSLPSPPWDVSAIAFGTMVSGDGRALVMMTVGDGMTTKDIWIVTDIDGNEFNILTSLGMNPDSMILQYLNGTSGLVVGNIRYGVASVGPAYADPYHGITDLIPIPMHDGDPGLGTTATALDVNALGWIVGFHNFGGNDVPFIFLNGTTYELQDLLPPPFNVTWTLTSAYAVSDDGYIIGRGVNGGAVKDFVMRMAVC